MSWKIVRTRLVFSHFGLSLCWHWPKMFAGILSFASAVGWFIRFKNVLRSCECVLRCLRAFNAEFAKSFLAQELKCGYELWTESLPAGQPAKVC